MGRTKALPVHRVIEQTMAVDSTTASLSLSSPNASPSKRSRKTAAIEVRLRKNDDTTLIGRLTFLTPSALTPHLHPTSLFVEGDHVTWKYPEAPDVVQTLVDAMHVQYMEAISRWVSKQRAALVYDATTSAIHLQLLPMAFLHPSVPRFVSYSLNPDSRLIMQSVGLLDVSLQASVSHHHHGAFSLQALYSHVRDAHADVAEFESFSLPLTVALRPYQRRAVQWMIQREEARFLNEDWASLVWEQMTVPDSSEVIYRHKYSLLLSRTQPTCSSQSLQGGILADEMGLIERWFYNGLTIMKGWEKLWKLFRAFSRDSVPQSIATRFQHMPLMITLYWTEQATKITQPVSLAPAHLS